MFHYYVRSPFSASKPSQTSQSLPRVFPESSEGRAISAIASRPENLCEGILPGEVSLVMKLAMIYSGILGYYIDTFRVNDDCYDPATARTFLIIDIPDDRNE